MKKLFVLIIVIFLTSALFAQPKSNYEKYREAIDDSIAQSQVVQNKAVVKSNRPATIFNRHTETTKPQTYADTDINVNIYVTDPFDYSMFYSPFAFSFGFWGYPYYGFYDPWYYDYGFGYPYYGYPYYGYGRGGGYYHSHEGDRGRGALGSHRYGESYNHGNGNINNKTLGDRYSSYNRKSSPSVMTNRPAYRENRSMSNSYSQSRMNIRPNYNNTKTQSGSLGIRQRSRIGNSSVAQQRSQTKSSSTPRSSAPRSSAPVSRSYSAPSHSSGGSFSGNRSSGGSFGGGSRSSGSYGGSHGRR
jgi:uncharacterized membrane protein YgcG